MIWDKYADKFEIFRDTEAVIVEKSAYNSLMNTYKTTEIGTVIGDLQDYSGGMAEKEFGLTVECQKKFYCSESDLPKVGRYMKISDKFYRIEYVTRGKLGTTALLKEVELK